MKLVLADTYPEFESTGNFPVIDNTDGCNGCVPVNSTRNSIAEGVAKNSVHTEVVGSSTGDAYPCLVLKFLLL